MFKSPPSLSLSGIHKHAEQAYLKAKRLDYLKTPIAIAEGNLQLILRGQVNRREYQPTIKCAYQALQKIKKILREDYES